MIQSRLISLSNQSWRNLQRINILPSYSSSFKSINNISYKSNNQSYKSNLNQHYYSTATTATTTNKINNNNNNNVIDFSETDDTDIFDVESESKENHQHPLSALSGHDMTLYFKKHFLNKEQNDHLNIEGLKRLITEDEIYKNDSRVISILSLFLIETKCKDMELMMTIKDLVVEKRLHHNMARLYSFMLLGSNEHVDSNMLHSFANSFVKLQMIDWALRVVRTIKKLKLVQPETYILDLKIMKGATKEKLDKYFATNMEAIEAFPKDDLLNFRLQIINTYIVTKTDEGVEKALKLFNKWFGNESNGATIDSRAFSSLLIRLASTRRHKEFEEVWQRALMLRVQIDQYVLVKRVLTISFADALAFYQDIETMAPQHFGSESLLSALMESYMKLSDSQGLGIYDDLINTIAHRPTYDFLIRVLGNSLKHNFLIAHITTDIFKRASEIEAETGVPIPKPLYTLLIRSSSSLKDTTSTKVLVDSYTASHGDTVDVNFAAFLLRVHLQNEDHTSTYEGIKALNLYPSTNPRILALLLVFYKTCPETVESKKGLAECMKLLTSLEKRGNPSEHKQVEYIYGYIIEILLSLRRLTLARSFYSLLDRFTIGKVSPSIPQFFVKYCIFQNKVKAAEIWKQIYKEKLTDQLNQRGQDKPLFPKSKAYSKKFEQEQNIIEE